MLKLEALKIPDLDAIDLAVAAGECVGMTGASGSGKTRLLRAIADLDEHGGRVFVDNTEQQSMPAHDWRRRVGLLPAESAWWLDSVGEHFGVSDATRPDRERFAALGFEADVLKWKVSRLSSGEKQRLAVLRMLQTSPQALLLDEPTANLDADNSEAVERLIGDYLETRDAAAIWVSHDRAQLARVSVHLYRISKGVLEAVS